MARKIKTETEKTAEKAGGRTARSAKTARLEAAAPAVAELRPNQPASDETRARLVPTHEEISRRAHELWVERGGMGGSAQEDWLRAERELRAPPGR